MDVGVGAFLFAAALTSKQSRGSLSIEKRRVLFLKTLKSVSPLLLLGLIRLLSVKATDYHVTQKRIVFIWMKFKTVFDV